MTTAYLFSHFALAQSDNDASLAQLRSAFQADGVLEELSLSCNRDFAPLEALVDKMTNVLEVLRASVDRALSLAECDRIVPIYTNTFYDGTCDYSVKAVFWVFSCTLIIGFFGMLMIMFRSALKPTIYEEKLLEGADELNLHTSNEGKGEEGTMYEEKLADGTEEFNLQTNEGEGEEGDPNDEYAPEPGEENLEDVPAQVEDL
jgi:hypothetical protein